MQKIVIVGGGISGLACAFSLSKSVAFKNGDLTITVLEASERFGGIIETVKAEDCLIESGPDSFITNKPQMLALAHELGLAERVVNVSEKNRGALVVNRGRLCPLPAGFVMLAPSSITSFMQTSLLSLPGRLRAMLDLVLPVRTSTEDESLADFVRRRFGDEVLERLAQPLVAGIYVGDAEKLSARSVAARFVTMERTTGSVITALRQERLTALKNNNRADQIQKQSESGARYSLFASFDEGMQVIVDALVYNLRQSGVDLRLATQVTALEKEADTYRLTVTDNHLPASVTDADIATNFETATNIDAANLLLTADQVVLAAGSGPAARLTSSVAPELSEKLSALTAASSAVVNFVFARKDIGHPLNSFGVVVPVIEMKKYKLSCLALSFASLKFKRSPEDKIVIRAFVGGMRDKNILDSDDAKLIDLALSDLRFLVKLRGAPLYARVHRWSESMPQYEVGHDVRIETIEKSTIKGLHLCGAYLHGVGLPDCVLAGEKAAAAALAQGES